MSHAITPDHSSNASSAVVNERAADCARRLRIVLRLNAATSATSGLAMAAAPSLVDDLLGTGAPGWIRVVGLALVPFAALVAWLSTTDVATLRRLVPGIVVGDIGWVLASVATIALGWYSGTGVVAVIAMALVVDGFALLQFNAVRHLRRR